MRKLSGAVLLVLAVLLAGASYRFLIVMSSAGVHGSARAVIIYIAFVIIGISYLLRTAFRLLK